MFGNNTGRKSSHRKSPAISRQLYLETLESRLAPASLPVDLISHLAQLTSDLGISRIFAGPGIAREVPGSVYLKATDLVQDPVEDGFINAPEADIEPSEDELDDLLDDDLTADDLLIETDDEPESDDHLSPSGDLDNLPSDDLPVIDPINGIGIINPMAPGLPGLGTNNPINPGIGGNQGNGELPEVDGDLPGAANQPGANGNLPGGAGNLPGNGANLPGGGANLPGNGANLPGGGANLPGNGANLPGGGANLPGNGPILPGVGTILPGVGAFPIGGINPINPATGNPYWPNPGPMPGEGINPGSGIQPGNGVDGPTGQPTGPGSGGTNPTGSSPTSVLRVSGIDPDTGSSNSDRITKAKSPSVLGTAPANSQITVLSAGSVIGRGVTDASGKFKAPLSVALADGEHLFQVNCSNGSTASLRVTIDTQAPAPTITATRWVPEKVNLEVKLGWASTASAGDSILLDVDLNQNGAFEDNELAYRTGTADSVFVLNNLNGYGDYTLRARAVDTAGNVGTATAMSFVDRNAGFVGDDSLRKMAQGAYEALGYSGKWDGRSIVIDPEWKPNSKDLNQPITISISTGIISDFGNFLKSAQDLGMTQVTARPEYGYAEGIIPTFKILSLPSLPGFSTASMIWMATRMGTIQNQGIPAMRVPQYMAETGYTGIGMKIGVLSDSVNVNGSLTNAIASGDLPANVEVLYDAPAGNDEGTAMLEIIYDVAPGASLAFNSAGPGPQGFANGIQALSDAGCQVIVDDIVYLNQPVYNEGVVNLSVTDVVENDGRFYASAAGNDGDNGWRGSWRTIAGTVGGISGNFMSFGGLPYQQVGIPDGDGARFAITWDSAYLEVRNPDPNFQVPNQVNAYLIDLSTNTVVASSTTDNLNSDQAFQIFAFGNSGGATNYGLAFELVSGPTPTRLAWIAYGANDLDISDHGSPGAGITVSGAPNSRGAVGVAAAYWGTPTQPEPFTSKGGTMELLFAADGSRLATPENYFRPQLTAPDGVSTTVTGFDPFYGTSAAAPQVAAVAALVWGYQPQMTNEQLTFHLYATATDIYTPGEDVYTGFGLIQAYPVQSDAFGSGDISNNSLSAWHLGTVGSSPLLSRYLDISNQAGLPDYDWFTLRAGKAGKLNLRMLQGSSGSLEVRFFTLDKNMSLVQRAASTAPGLLIRNISMDVFANELVYIEVKGRNSAYGVTDEAFYQMTLKVS